jgi:hypothetical protein
VSLRTLLATALLGVLLAFGLAGVAIGITSGLVGYADLKAVAEGSGPIANSVTFESGIANGIIGVLFLQVSGLLLLGAAAVAWAFKPWQTQPATTSTTPTTSTKT